MKDYYKILGISEDASQDEVEEGFRAALLNAGTVGKAWFEKYNDREMNVMEAHGVLTNPESRCIYNREQNKVTDPENRKRKAVGAVNKSKSVQPVAQAGTSSWAYNITTIVVMTGLLLFAILLRNLGITIDPGWIVLVVGGVAFCLWLISNTPKWVAQKAMKKSATEEMLRRDKIAVATAEEQLRRYNAEILGTQEEARMARYRQLRKEIEAMPNYQFWREDVLRKFGRKCAICDSTENIEVDHRYKSFYAIVRDYGITNTIQAYECPALWDINNGAPLCKLHHDQTKSSRYHEENDPK